MSLFKVVPCDQSLSSAEIDAPDASRIFAIVQNLACQEEGVLRAGIYAFSVRLGDNGFWTIFQRGEIEAGESTSHSANLLDSLAYIPAEITHRHTGDRVNAISEEFHSTPFVEAIGTVVRQSHAQSEALSHCSFSFVEKASSHASGRLARHDENLIEHFVHRPDCQQSNYAAIAQRDV